MTRHTKTYVSDVMQVEATVIEECADYIPSAHSVLSGIF